MDAKTNSISKGMPEAGVKYRPYPAINIPDRTWHDALYDACAGAALFSHILRVTGWENPLAWDVGI